MIVEWISVKDRLPPINKEVLGVNQFDEYMVCLILKPWVDEEKGFYTKNFGVFFPVYWMPLPERPKDKDED